MSLVYIAADNHRGPGEKRQIVYDFLEEARDNAQIYVNLGDDLEAVRYGWKALAADEACLAWCRFVNESASKLQVFKLQGNHDWGEAAQHLFAPPVELSSSVTLREGTATFYFTHGWEEFDLSLNWLRRWYGKLFGYLPQYAWLYDKIFATPGQLPKHHSLPNDTYWGFVLHMSYLAARMAVTRGMHVFWGHTHNLEIRRLEGTLCCNAGTALEPDNYGLILDTATLEVRKWQR